MTISMQPGSSDPSRESSSCFENSGEAQGAASTSADGEEGETAAEFPVNCLERLEEMINRTKWVIPVLPDGELEVLLNSSIDYCRRGVDLHSEPCQRFFRDGLVTSFTKVLTDDAVSGWKPEIQKCIYKNCEKFIELCVLKLKDDCICLLEVLAMVFNPQSKFHTYNSIRTSEAGLHTNNLSDSMIYAKPSDLRVPRSWLIDLINLFGRLGGFRLLMERFKDRRGLTVMISYALLRPVGLCHEFLTVTTIEKYILPIVDIVPDFLEKLSDGDLKKEAKSESKNDALSTIVKLFKSLVSHVPGQEENIKMLEMFRLKMILRLLKISSFNGKMNALNELNKVIGNMAYYSHGRSITDQDETLNAGKMALWIKQNKVLQIVLCDSLHQPQYVEKLEKILRFIIKEKALTLDDLDCLWSAQCGRHEAIVKNVHDLLAKLAWDFSPDQLDHLFSRFSTSWVSASKKQREKLLELIRRLAEEDKDGVMAHKVLQLLWTLAHSQDLPNDIMDQALSAHLKILDCSCSQDRDAQKLRWVSQCVGDLNSDKWVLPALKQIRDICFLYQEAPPTYNHAQRLPQHGKYRSDVINNLQEKHSLVCLISESLTAYMHQVAQLKDSGVDIDPETYCVDGRYNHIEQIEQRLNFLSFILKEGKLWLCAPQPKQIWNCLAERAVFHYDRELCFKWFCNLMSEGPDIEPGITQDFFEQNILQLDPALLTENGIECFDYFFKTVNVKACKLIPKKNTYLMEHEDLIGLDYLWRVVMQGTSVISSKAIELLKETYTNLGPRLRSQQDSIHRELINNCMNRLRACYDTISVLSVSADDELSRRKQAVTMYRVLSVLYEYIGQNDREYGDDRVFLPLFRAYCGKRVTVVLRLPTQGKNFDITVETHTQETLSALRRHVLQRTKASNAHTFFVELYLTGDPMELIENKVCVGEVMAGREEVILTAKLCSTNTIAGSAVGAGVNVPSSPDSSSDSSAPSPQHVHQSDGSGGTVNVCVEAECQLPSVIWSKHSDYVEFLLQLSELGCSIGYVPLRDAARGVLEIVPAAPHVCSKLISACQSTSASSAGVCGPASALDVVFFESSPSHVLYCLQVMYSLLMPADNSLTEKRCSLHRMFIVNGGAAAVLKMLTDERFLSTADAHTKRQVYLYVVRLVKLVLATVGFMVRTGDDSVSGDASNKQRNTALCLPVSESFMCNVAMITAKSLSPNNTSCLSLELAHIEFMLKLVWWSCGSSPVAGPRCDMSELYFHDKVACVAHSDVELCRETLEILPLMLCIRRDLLDVLTREFFFSKFILDMTLICRSDQLRLCACEQVMVIVTQSSVKTLLFFMNLLFSSLEQNVQQNAETAREFFDLLCRLLDYACLSELALPRLDSFLRSEIAWLLELRLAFVRATACSSSGQDVCRNILLEGHLKVTAKLVAFLSPSVKSSIDTHNSISLSRELLNNFLLTHSVVLLQMERSGHLPERLPVVICATPETRVAAYDVLVALCTGSLENLRVVVNQLLELFYSDSEDSVVDWDYSPPIGNRPPGGFVGLKNAGATCYMNSVLQQLFMIDEVRRGVLSTQGVCHYSDEDLSGEERVDNEAQLSDNDSDNRRCENVREYNIGILKWLQVIFGHLMSSQLQSYVPRGLWTHFKLLGEPVNLREQHDAIEFFVSLVDSVDEAQKALGQPQVMSRQLRGTFSDQKICKQCPHRYSKEETFTVLNVDIHNFNSLTESLDQYVKGDLLEGANAYHCDKCNKKVDTVKRTCIKKLPPTLCIQLKRFDYDWERECAIKFNDYFEFPRQLDMEPYTVRGLARIEGELIGSDLDDEQDGCAGDGSCSSYQLTGIVVHSGQASGGHYYSYVLHRACTASGHQWYKFDDCDVSECHMDDDEELRTQCFGGEYLGEVFDQMMKRMSSRRQKRWWNAYILFYTRQDVLASPEPGTSRAVQSQVAELSRLSLADRSGCGEVGGLSMPLSIQRSILRQNIRFFSTRNKFYPEYVQFIRKLVLCNAAFYQNEKLHSRAAAEVAVLSVSLACSFLFTIGFHMKKSVRGPAADWYDALSPHLSHSSAARVWLANHVIYSQPAAHRLTEYLLECPTSEVRLTFARLLVLLAQRGTSDIINEVRIPALSQLAYHVTYDLSEAVLLSVLSLLKKDVSDHCRHLPQYFSFFHMYANCGPRERVRLLKLNVPATFMLVALDEGPGPPIKSQYSDLGKLYQCVSLLVRSCDMSARTCSSSAGAKVLPNRFGEEIAECPGILLSPQAEDLLFVKSAYLKKLIEDASGMEESVSLLRYCCWENYSFSCSVLNELLCQISYGFNHELRRHLDLLLNILLLDDSWQKHRVLNALEGIRDGREGVFETISHFKNHYQKRAYQCIKFIVDLFTRCPGMHRIVMSNVNLRRRWCESVEWLRDELERRTFHTTTQYGADWSASAQSNETSNGYYLERSHSAVVCLERAFELYPEDEDDEDNEITELSDAAFDQQSSSSAGVSKVSPIVAATSRMLVAPTILQQKEPGLTSGSCFGGEGGGGDEDRAAVMSQCAGDASDSTLTPALSHSHPKQNTSGHESKMSNAPSN